MSSTLKRPRLLFFLSSRKQVSLRESSGSHQYGVEKKQASIGQERTRASTRSTGYSGYVFPNVYLL